jgi:hypothetical protein
MHKVPAPSIPCKKKKNKNRTSMQVIKSSAANEPKPPKTQEQAKTVKYPLKNAAR